jgi:RNA recognition motif-containing protein
MPELRASVRLHLGNVRWSATEQELRDFCSHFGEVKELMLVRDALSGRSRGFGFVEFWAGDAASLIEQMDGVDFRGRPLRVGLARPRGANWATGARSEPTDVQ